MTGGKRLRIAALFVIVLVFAFIMDMSSNAITDNTLIRNDTGDGDAVYDLVLNADGLDEDYSYQLRESECGTGQRACDYEGCICIGSCGGRVDTE